MTDNATIPVAHSELLSYMKFAIGGAVSSTQLLRDPGFPDLLALSYHHVASMVTEAQNE